MLNFQDGLLGTTFNSDNIKNKIKAIKEGKYNKVYEVAVDPIKFEVMPQLIKIKTKVNKLQEK
ncbi:hypothetical protein [Caldiplasma sukawensis]